MKLKFSGFLLLPFLAACTSIQIDRSADAAQVQRKAAEENEINNGERLLALGRFEEAHQQFRSFQQNYPQSLYFQSSRLGEAQSLEGLGKWNEAVQIDRDVYLKTFKTEPKIAALALYRMSFAYEAMGDDLKTVAALLDARKMGDYLPAEIAKAEVPARLAAVYGRQGREREAMQYLNEAEKGLSEVRFQKKDIDTSWLAKTYLQMGSISTNQLSADNFTQAVQSQNMVQVYLIKAMQVNDPVWSPRAVIQAKQTYQTLFSLLEQSRSNRQQQIAMGGSLVDLMDQADLFKPLQGQTYTASEKDFFTYLQDVRKRTEEILYQSGESTSLTAESQKLNSIKRPGRIKTETLLPEEENRPVIAPPKIVPTEDPNL